MKNHSTWVSPVLYHLIQMPMYSKDGETCYFRFDLTRFLNPKIDSDELCRQMLEVYSYFEKHQITDLEGDYAALMAVVAKAFFCAITNPDFKISMQYAVQMITINPLLANLAAMTKYKTTDSFIPQVSDDPIKRMILTNASCTTEQDVHSFFNHDPYLATIWWSTALDTALNNVNATVSGNLTRWLSDPYIHENMRLLDDRFALLESVVHPYFWTSYFDPSQEKILKPVINQKIRQFITQPPAPATRPHPQKILLASWFFKKGHAVYRCLSPLIRSLKPDYHITQLILDTGTDSRNQAVLDDTIADEFIYINDVPDSGEVSPQALKAINSGEFNILLMPDIGMNFNSIALSNTRVAPIQIACYGHPVSTHGSEIDYFITGAESECGSSNYSERMVVIPGMGIEADYPDYKRVYPDKPSDKVIVSCSWGNVKFSHEQIWLLKQIQDNSTVPVVFNFMGLRGTRLYLPPLKLELERIFGADGFMLSSYVPHTQYCQQIEACHFGIDSFPFGSYNRIIDTLLCGLPIVARAGDRAYNRFAAAILHRVGLSELVATTSEAFMSVSLKLANDTAYRNQLCEYIATHDIRGAIVDTANHKYFKQAIDYLVSMHHKVKNDTSQLPILITNHR